MNKSQIPPNWDDLVKKHWELVTDEQYYLVANWPTLEADAGYIASQPRHINIIEVSLKSNSGNASNIIPIWSQPDSSVSAYS